MTSTVNVAAVDKATSRLAPLATDVRSSGRQLVVPYQGKFAAGMDAVWESDARLALRAILDAMGIQYSYRLTDMGVDQLLSVDRILVDCAQNCPPGAYRGLDNAATAVASLARYVETIRQHFQAAIDT